MPPKSHSGTVSRTAEYPNGRRRGPEGVLEGYSRGTQGVLKGYSRGTRGVLEGQLLQPPSAHSDQAADDHEVFHKRIASMPLYREKLRRGATAEG